MTSSSPDRAGNPLTELDDPLTKLDDPTCPSSTLNGPDEMNFDSKHGVQHYTVADYLADRLVELGVDRVFGVPGDFTLALLDHVVERPDLAWTGCANELNAGYAADGYARLRGIGAFTTTFGVGELSAVNAVAGSYAEHVPVVEIVGAPATTAQAAARIVHHSLGDGVFDHFMDLHRNITCARAALTATNATVEIDRVLTSVRDLGLPGYLLVPTDVAATSASAPPTPLLPKIDATDRAALAAFTDAARHQLHQLHQLHDPAGPLESDAICVLGGVMVHRSGATDDFRALLEAGGMPHATSLWGKSLVDETSPAYLGSYVGAASNDDVRHAVEDAELLIVAGVQFTDLNSGFFTHKIDRARTIELAPLSASVGQALFSPITLPRALQALTTIVHEHAEAHRPRTSGSPPEPEPHRHPSADQSLDQISLWRSVAAHLCPGDIVLADQGTSFYGMATQRLPRDVTFIGQPLWASIGYTLPALLGACHAAPGRRGILLIGDGAAQMTLQELGTIARAGLDVIVLIVDNAGYTVERAIHGPDATYNDIATIDWAGLPQLLTDHPTRGTRATTQAELDQALDAATPRPTGLHLIQAVLDPDDVPPLLATLARQVAHANAPTA